MKFMFLVLIPMLFLASCIPQQTLYTWKDYDVATYNYLKNTDDESVQKLIESYRQIISEQNGTRGVVPPGIYADYGFLLIQEGQINQGKEMLNREIALYPESKPFIERILKMLEE